MGALEVVKDSMPNLHSAAVSEKELFAGVIDFTRPLNEYPTIETIIKHIQMGLPAQNIPTASINVNGRVVADSMEKYLDNESLSSSVLKASFKTPLHFHFALSEDKEELDKLRDPKYFNLGTFLHQCLLEPTKFSRAIVEPKFTRASKDSIEIGIKFYEDIINKQGTGLLIREKDGEAVVVETAASIVLEELDALIRCSGVKPESLEFKKNYLECIIEAADVYVVSEEQKMKIDILKRHVDNYGGGIIKRLLTHAKREVSVYHTDPESGLRLKVRPDALQFKENIGVDAIISVKSSACEDLNAFFANAAKLHYDLSEGMYQEIVSAATGRDFNTTIMIMLQTVAPFAVAVLVWKAEDIEMGKHKYRIGLQNAKEIIEKNSSKGYEVYAEEGNFGLIEMSLPGWNQREQLPINI